MKLLVFADTHGRPQPMLDVLAREVEDTSAVLHLGDGVGDTDAVREVWPRLPLFVVRGNCDMASPDPEEGLAPMGGLLVYYTHGHLLNVKQNTDMLWWRARRKKADVALYGHTHTPAYDNRSGLHLFNPGSVSLPRIGRASYGVITVTGGAPAFDIRYVE